MPRLNIAMPHNLSQDEVRTRIQNLVSQSCGQLGGIVSDLLETWAENTGTFSFRVTGFLVSGRLHAEASKVRVEINLPLGALQFKRRIETEMASRAKALLS